MLYFYVDIFAGFQCQMCGSCCRNNWMVTIDKSSYERNAALFQLIGRSEEFQQAFLRIENPGVGEYAMIAKQPQGGCWFLQPDNLCRLHREYGHVHLDAVCQTYPRYPMNTARGVELTLSLSCPTALAMAGTSPIEIKRSEMPPYRLYADSFVSRVYPQQYPANQPLHYYFELEQHFIDILQSRHLQMAERINMICDTAEKLAVKCFDMGHKVRTVMLQNYDRLEYAQDYCSDNESDILLENYFVNMIFRKLFYERDLPQGASILRVLWLYLQQAYNVSIKEPIRLERLRSAISELEFEYGHHRSHFNRRCLQK